MADEDATAAEEAAAAAELSAAAAADSAEAAEDSAVEAFFLQAARPKAAAALSASTRVTDFFIERLLGGWFPQVGVGRLADIRQRLKAITLRGAIKFP